jgi:hypothetical protein
METEPQSYLMEPISVTKEEVLIAPHVAFHTSVSKMEHESKISGGDVHKVRAGPLVEAVCGKTFVRPDYTTLTKNRDRKAILALEQGTRALAS